jgi:quinol monooxygenase YgiN
MDRTIVTYKVKEGRVEENEALVQAVYAGLEANGHAGIHYGTYKKEDGLTFVHIAAFESEEAREVFNANEAFKAFTAEIGERCDIPPKPENVGHFASYNF